VIEPRSTTFKGGALFIVATPIGNLQDITVRALNLLKQVDLIAAEDTRHTQKLLKHHQIFSRLVSYHEHNEEKRTPQLIEKLKAGNSIALVSDAGTPLISDPGYRLVTEAIDENIPVIPIPGVCAVTTALSASGMPPNAFAFEGFIPRKGSKRSEKLKSLSLDSRTLIFYENPQRVLSLIKDLLSSFGDRKAVVAREMTKAFEEFIRGSLSELLAELKNRPELKGEFTVVIEGCKRPAEMDLEPLQTDIRLWLASGKKLSEMAKTLSKRHGLSKNLVYRQILKTKKTV
jgi:16S rRNA (cytidine1402-2'-O)-methyltransferase